MAKHDVEFVDDCYAWVETCDGEPLEYFGLWIGDRGDTQPRVCPRCGALVQLVRNGQNAAHVEIVAEKGAHSQKKMVTVQKGDYGPVVICGPDWDGEIGEYAADNGDFAIVYPDPSEMSRRFEWYHEVPRQWLKRELANEIC